MTEKVFIDGNWINSRSQQTRETYECLPGGVVNVITGDGPDPLTDNDAAPFGGMRWSGIGRELGEEGLDAFREPKHVHLDYVMERKDYWYPYAKRPIPSGHSQ